jgi:hypothetical protein
MTDWLNLGLTAYGLGWAAIGFARYFAGDAKGFERAMTLGILFVLLGNTK